MALVSEFFHLGSFELWGRRTEGVVVTNDCGMKCRADCGALRTGSQAVSWQNFLAWKGSKERVTCNIHHPSSIGKRASGYAGCESDSMMHGGRIQIVGTLRRLTT